jgi:hypothetical protein
MSLNDKPRLDAVCCHVPGYIVTGCAECDRLRAALDTNEKAYEIAQGIIIEQQGKICDLTEDNDKIRALCAAVYKYAMDADSELKLPDAFDGKLLDALKAAASGREWTK